jgi:hypothetical protein
MRFFTPELLERYSSTDPASASAAEAEWEAVNERYSEHLQALEPGLPAHLRAFNALLLHDAALLSLAREGSRLLMVLKKDIPPRDLVIVRYDMAEEPVLVPFARQPRDWQKPTCFDFDEFDREQDGREVVYTQGIVFANGWELRLRFRDVQVTLAEPWVPANGQTGVPSASPTTSCSTW